MNFVLFFVYIFVFGGWWVWCVVVFFCVSKVVKREWRRKEDNFEWSWYNLYRIPSAQFSQLCYQPSSLARANTCCCPTLWSGSSRSRASNRWDRFWSMSKFSMIPSTLLCMILYLEMMNIMLVKSITLHPQINIEKLLIPFHVFHVRDSFSVLPTHLMSKHLLINMRSSNFHLIENQKLLCKKGKTGGKANIFGF